MNSERLLFLLSAYLDGALAPDDKAELEQALRVSAAARAQFWEHTLLHNQLRCVLAETGLQPVPPQGPEDGQDGPRSNHPGNAWLRHPLRALAAAVVLSVVFTSAVWAYAGQLFSHKTRVVRLLNAGFENLSSIPPLGVPDRPDHWSGDYAELVGAEKGVRPRSGKTMLRFVRADNASSQSGPPNYVAEAIHVVDLRPYRSELRSGAAHLEVAAWFASAAAADGQRVRFLLKAATFSGEPSDAPALWEESSRASLSMVQQQIDPSPVEGDWKALTVSLPVPARAEFLVFECAALQVHPRLREGTATFSAHYLDDVTVQLRVAAPAPSLNALPGTR